MIQYFLDEKYKKVAKIVCKQGMFPFPVSDTAVSIIEYVVKTEKELDFICAFNKAPSQILEQLTAVSGFMEQEVETLATG